ncbi:MAG: hypothetical protein WBA16_11360 [Nonlabens sp.]
MSSLLVFFGCKENNTTIDNDLDVFLPVECLFALHSNDPTAIMTQLLDQPVIPEKNSSTAISSFGSMRSFTQFFNAEGESLALISPEGKTQQAFTIINAAPIDIKPENASISYAYDGETIVKLSIKLQDFYEVKLAQKQIISTSKLILESIIRNFNLESKNDSGLKSLLRDSDVDDSNIFFRSSERNPFTKALITGNIDNNNFTKSDSWFALKMASDPVEMNYSGVAINDEDTVLFSSIDAGSTSLTQIIPANFTQLNTYSYRDGSKLWEVLKEADLEDNRFADKEYVSNSSEVAFFTVNEGECVAFKLLESESTDALLEGKLLVNYRQKEIRQLEKPLKTEGLSKLSNSGSYSYTARFDDILVLSSSQEAMEVVIANHNSDTTLEKQPWWIVAGDHLSSVAHKLQITSLQNLQDQQRKLTKEDFDRFKNYPYLIEQLTYEGDIAHVAIDIPRNNPNAQGASQLTSYRSNTPITSGPFLFPNHRTMLQDVLFQDAGFNLILVNENGVKQWSKPLDGPILGKPQFVDAYKNNRRQIIFSTKEKIYFIDRDGNNLNRFPVTIKGGNTQPVAVFEYDLNRNYRILATSGSSSTMYDYMGRVVKGFKYEPSGNIKHLPEHFKIGTKDFIVLLLEDGTPQILSRTGKIRTTLKQPVRLTNIYGILNEQLVALNSQKKLVALDLNTGKATMINSDIRSNNFDFSKGKIITVENNTISDGQLDYELPYGEYGLIKAHVVNQQKYYVLDHPADKKIYMLDDQMRMLSGFPIYGERPVDLLYYQGSYRLATLDDKDILVYEWKPTGTD